MGKSHFFRDPAGIVNVAPCAAGPLFRKRRAVVIKLQGHAHNIIALRLQFSRHDRAVDAT